MHHAAKLKEIHDLGTRQNSSKLSRDKTLRDDLRLFLGAGNDFVLTEPMDDFFDDLASPKFAGIITPLEVAVIAMSCPILSSACPRDLIAAHRNEVALRSDDRGTYLPGQIRRSQRG